MAISDTKASAGEKAVSAKTKSAKESKPRKPKTASSHPSYFEMIGDAITSLKERTGSSQYAIAKYIQVKHTTNLPSNFKKMLLYHLKKLVADGKLVKVKNSFKISTVGKTLPAKKPSPALSAAKAKPKPKAKAAVTMKPKSASMAGAKAKAKAKAKPKVTGVKRKPAGAAKPPAKAKKVAAKASPAKKKVPSVKAKKPKSVKSPVKKVATVKKTTKKAK